jgi:hypothetical protein
MSTITIYTYVPCFPGFTGNVLALNELEHVKDYLDDLCYHWDMPLPVIEEYFKQHNELTFDWDAYRKDACPVYCNAVEDLIYKSTDYDIDVTLSFVRQEYITTIGRRVTEEEKLVAKADFDPEILIAYIRTDADSFTKYLKKRKAKPDLEKWLNPDNWVNQPRALELILEYILASTVKNPVEKLAENFLHEVDPEEYIGTPEDFTNYIQDDEGDACYRLNAEYERLMRQGPAYLEAMKKTHPRGWRKYIPEVERGKVRVIRELAEDLDRDIRKYTAEKSA